MPTLILIVVVLLAFAWFFLVLPVAAAPALAPGDAGLGRGRRRDHHRGRDPRRSSARSDDDELRIEIAPGVVVTLDRRAIAAVARGRARRDDEPDEAGARQEDQAEEP